MLIVYTDPVINRRALPILVTTMLLASCAPNPSVYTSPTASSRATTEPAVASATPTQAKVACLSQAEALPLAARVGQLYMVAVSTNGVSGAVSVAIKESLVGSVVLLDNTTGGAKYVADLSNQVRSLGPVNLPVLVAADQEGGRVQRLAGAGFAPIPTAVQQAEMSTPELAAAAKTWGEQLRAAGVRFNLAPVADVVPASKVSTNEPIGKLRRGYGSDPVIVAEKVAAVVQGMRDAKVATSLKHFPGLGQVVANTDFGVAKDATTSAGDAGWQPFRTAIGAGASSVMVSSAIYTQLDPSTEAMFSKPIVTGILRDQFGFDKVIISDDLGAAAAVKDVPVAERGTRFLLAGGDLAINADPSTVGAMVANTLAKAEADPAFAAQVTRSAARVLELKASVDLVDCG